MEGISDIKIIGLDERRPPRIRKEPYINLFFRLSHKAPTDWCQRFNNLLSKHSSTPKIKPDEGVFIETWVRLPDEITAHLELLKSKVAECSAAYIDDIMREQARGAEDLKVLGLESGEQGRLNKIIAGLNFDSN
jgi:predicted DNA-binding protein